MSQIYYRLREQLEFHSEMKIIADTFKVIKETPKGAWIVSDRYTNGKKHFVLNGSGKRFAYPDLDAAIASFKQRKIRQIQLLENQLIIARAALNGVKAEDFKVNQTFEDETLDIFVEY